MTAPLVSVVIPTYNYARFVGAAVESALAQTYAPVEVIVVDDGSTDDTPAVLAQYAGKIRVVTQANAGLSAARNTGIAYAAGELVALLDSDDLFHPRKLELQVPVLVARPEAGLVAARHVDGPTPIWEELPPEPIPAVDVSLDDLVLIARFGSSGVVLRKACIPEVGEFDTTLRSAEDRDMWIRLATKFAVIRVEAALWWYRPTPGSMSRNAGRMETNERAVIEKAFRCPELKSRWLFRRKVRGLAAYSAAFMFLDGGQPAAGLRRAVSSFVWWPGTYSRAEVRYRWGRLKLAAACARACLSRGRS